MIAFSNDCFPSLVILNVENGWSKLRIRLLVFMCYRSSYSYWYWITMKINGQMTLDPTYKGKLDKEGFYFLSH